MKYDLILFDADETLFDFKKAEEYALENTMMTLGMEYRRNIHLPSYKIVNSAIWKELEDGLISQKELKVERFRRFSATMGIEFDAVEFAKLYMGFLGQGSFLFDDSMELIRSIHEDYKLMIITNGLTAVQDNRIRNSRIAKYFQRIIVSEDIGVSKPDCRIFEYALSSLQKIDKSRILMVGDSLRSDMRGGLNFGIDTCWYNPEKMENTEAITPTYEIHSLMELKEVLE